MKKRQNLGVIDGKNTRNKALCWLFFMFLIFSIAQINTVSAWDWDNIKEYKEDTKTAEVYNSWLIPNYVKGDKIAEITLLSEPNVLVVDRGEGVLQKVAEFKIKNLEKRNDYFLKKLDLYDIKAGMKEFNREVVLKKKVKVGEHIVKHISGDCSDYVSSENEECPYKTVTNKTQDVFEWVELTDKELKELDVGEITIGLFTDVEENERVEWIPNLFGVEVEEWATWTASLTEITFHAYLLDEGSGSLMSDSQFPQENITLVDGTPDWDASGKFNSSYKPDGNDNENFNFNYMNFTDEGFSVQVWARYDASSTGYMLGSDITGSSRFYVEKVTESGGCYRVRGGVAGTEWGFECPQLATYQHWVWVVNTTWAGWYANGTLVQSADITFNFTSPTDAFDFQVWDTTNNGALPFTILTEMSTDEIYWFNTTLTASQVSDLWNSGSGIQFNPNPTLPDASPTATLNAPANHTNSTSPTLILNASAEDDSLIQNITIYINGVANYTHTHGTSNFSSFEVNLSFADGNYNWTVVASDNASTIQYGWADNRTFTVDTKAPTVSVLFPKNLTSIITTNSPYNITINWSSTDEGIGLETCWYSNDSGTNNYTLACGNNESFNLAGGTHFFQFWANDTLGQTGSNSTTFTINYYNWTQYASTSSAGEGASVTFNLSLYSAVLGNPTARFRFNASDYVVSSSTRNSTNAFFTKTIAIPENFGNASGVAINWSWAFNITEIINSTTDNETLTVFEMSIDDCSVNDKVLMNWSFYDEELNTFLNITEIAVGEVEFETTIKSRINTSIDYIYNRTWSGKNETTGKICIPSGLANSTGENYWVDYLGYYKSSNLYVEEYYAYDNWTLSSTSTPFYIYLRGLKSADSTSFVVSFEDDANTLLEGAIIQVLRKYVGDATFREVERWRTDDDGEAILHLVEEDVIYQFNVSKEGVYLWTSEEYKVYCSSTTEVCTIELQQNPDITDFEDDWDNLPDGTYSVSADRNSRIITLVYNLDGDTAQKINMSVYKYSQNESEMNTIITSNYSTTTGDTLTVFVPLTYGNASYYVTLESNDNWFASESVDLTERGSDYFGSYIGVFFSALIVMSLSLMAVSQGVGVIIFGLAGLLFASIMFMLDINYAVIIYVFCAGAIVIWKIMRRDR